MSQTETMQFQATPDLRRQLESEAAKLNLSLYLYTRLVPGTDAARFDRHVREVFSRHGELMRRLAK